MTNSVINNDLFLEFIDPFVLFPVIPYSYEFALAAQKVITILEPAAIAISYPHHLQALVLQGVARLPCISVISHGDPRQYLRLEPVDAMAEVARLAHAAQLPLRCIGGQQYPQVTAILPDTYALQTIGHQRYVATVLQSERKTSGIILDSTPRDASNYQSNDTNSPEDGTLIAQTMAYYLKEWERKLRWSDKLVAGQKILVVCELPLFVPLSKSLTAKVVAANLPSTTPSEAAAPKPALAHLSPLSLGEIMGTFPFLTAVYEQQRLAQTTNLTNPPAPSIDPASSGLTNPASTGLTNPANTGLANFAAANKHSSSTISPASPRLTTPASSSSPPFTVLTSPPTLNLVALAIKAQQAAAQTVINRDRWEILNHYLLATRHYYEQEIKTLINPQQLLLLHNFARKYATIKKLLIPDFYELLIAGRGCFDDHFCYRLWEMGTCYPAQPDFAEIPTISLRAAEMFPFIQRIRMNPNAPLRPRATLPRFLQQRDKQKTRRWDDIQFDPHSICSYPPEDLCLENYGRYLRHKGKTMLSESEKRVHPFEASLLDGIDIRETLRNWHTGKIYVQEARLVKGTVDSLVVVFDEDSSEYPYKMTWLGEHEQESDMAFYATDPQLRVVAPGVNKALYGGFLMTLPPGRLYDVFRDPAYRAAITYAERLLFAAIDYSLEKFVIYVAARPPRPFFQALAGRYGKRIIYIPLKQLSPVMLQKIRTFHILADKSVRNYAADHIW
jgi:hypothetical protein